MFSFLDAFTINCFAFNEISPGGFTPRFGGDIEDRSITAGTSGLWGLGEWDDMQYDVSFAIGENTSNFYLRNTFNPSMGEDSPTDFYTGGYSQLEKTLNIDFVKPLPIHAGNVLNLAAGLEWREEIFEIMAGDPTSYLPGPLADQLFAIGSNGFSGFTEDSSGKFTRRNYALYIDTEAQISEQLVLGAAIRYEDFTTFGDTTNFKLSGRWQLTEEFAIRSSLSTGFRAPTMGQANVSNTQTSISEGQLTQVLTLPALNPVSQTLGGTALSPEESESMTLGITYVVDNFFITLDYYRIDVSDRITLSDNITPTDEQRSAMEALGVENVALIGEVNFFTNAFSTETQGIDIVANYSTELMRGSTVFSFAYNWNKTDVSEFSDITGEYKVRLLEESLPEHRATLTLFQTWTRFSAFIRANYYGEYWAVHVGWDETAIDASSVITVDAQVQYAISDAFSVAVGANNLFDQQAEALDFDPALGDWGAKYYETSPHGINGGLWYLKARYDY